MSVSFQALLGDTSIDANTINVDELDANTIRVGLGGGLVVMGDTVLHDLLIPDGAQDGFVLTSDAVGNTSWQPSAQTITLAGDVVGLSSANTVALVGGSTAASVNDTVQNRKYVGFWNTATAYKAGNQVSYNYNLFNCNTDNTNSNPEFSNTQIQFYTDAITPTVSANGTNVELGHAFSTTVEGFITGIRFYKYATTTLTSRKLSIWNFTTGAAIGSVTTIGERTTAGWVTAMLANPVYIAPGTSYLVSRSHTAGAYSTVNGFALANQTQGLTISGGWSGSIGSLPISSTTLNYFSDVIFQAKTSNSNWARVVSGIDENERSLIRAAYEPVVNATRLNQGSRIVRRDPTGSFSAGTITATFTGNVTGNLTGNASTATSATTATNFTGSLVGDVTGNQGTTFVSTLQGRPVSDYVTKDNVQILTNKDMLAGSNSIAATHLRPVSIGTQWTGGALPIFNNQPLTSGQVLTYTGTTGGGGYFQFENVPSGSTTLAGDVTGSSSSNTVSFIGGQTAAYIRDGAIWANNATTGNTFNALVRRDASGDFSAGTITANLTGTASNVITNANLTGEVTSVGNATTVTNAAVIGKVLTGFASTTGTVTATDSILSALQKTTGNLGTPTSTNTANAIVRRDASGNFAAGTITANLTGIASDVSNSSVISKVLTAFASTTGTITATDSILTAFQKTTGNLTAISTIVNNGTALATPNRLVLRDGNADTAVRDLTVRYLKNSGGLLTLNTSTGTDNVFFGFGGNTTTTGFQNTALGTLSGNALTDGNYNAFFGFNTGKLTTAGAYNSAFGQLALEKNITGTGNTAFGSQTLANTSSGIFNTAIGMQTGTVNTTGSNNTFVGTFSNSSTSNLMNSTAIGHEAVVTASNQIQLGNASVTAVNTSGSVSTGQTLIARSYVVPTGQGSYIGWNRDSGGGRTMFGNQRGLGGGGFEWINFDSSNAIVNPVPAMSLDGSGNLFVGGNAVANGNITGIKVMSSLPSIGYIHFPQTINFNIPATPGRYAISPTFLTADIQSYSDFTYLSPNFFKVKTAGTYKIEYSFTVVASIGSALITSTVQINSTLDALGLKASIQTDNPIDHIYNAMIYINLNVGDEVSMPYLATNSGSIISAYIRNGYMSVQRVV